MRRTLVAVSALAALVAVQAVALPAVAQNRQRPGQGGGAPDEDKEAAAKKKRDSEWNQPQAPLRQLRNAGPCPYVKVLYDAGRYIEFKDNREATGAVAYTGEIQGLASGCEYKDADPIKVRVEMLLGLGRGPQGGESRKTYRYWVAVTQRNQQVLAKEYFDLPVTFPAGQDRVMVNETIEDITIPRAAITVSGANFEVLVGFDVTPQMAEFNRDGKRFRANATAVATTTPSTTPGTTTTP